jgi:hypothetical protein
LPRSPKIKQELEAKEEAIAKPSQRGKGDRKDGMDKKLDKIEIQLPVTTGEIKPLNATRPLTSVDLYMISKALTNLAEEVKESIPSDKFQGVVDKTLRISFGYTKSEDVEKMVVQAAKPWRLLAAALNRLNKVSIETIVEDAERLAESEEGKAKKGVETALEKIKGKTLKMTKGMVRVAGVTIEEVIS